MATAWTSSAELTPVREDCRPVSGALERFLLARGERVVRVAPKLMAGARKSSRQRGKSHPIDAVAIARPAIREGLDTLSVAQLGGPGARRPAAGRPSRAARRAPHRAEQRLALGPAPSLARVRNPAAGLTGPRWQERVASRLAHAEQTVRVQIARDELRRIRELTRAIDAFERELAPRVAELAPRLLAERGCGVLTAAKLIGEVAGVHRFATDAKLARTAASAPIPASSGRTDRHRLDRGGNRQLNCALHGLAVSKARLDPETAGYLARKHAEGKSRREALRCLKRHLARRVFKLLQPPAPPAPSTPLGGRPPSSPRPAA